MFKKCIAKYNIGVGHRPIRATFKPLSISPTVRAFSSDGEVNLPSYPTTIFFLLFLLINDPNLIPKVYAVSADKLLLTCGHEWITGKEYG